VIINPARSHCHPEYQKPDNSGPCCSDKAIPNRLSRPGYTLIEMLIASVLVAALMSVVWGMMSMYNSYLTAGQAQAVEQQLIRSLLQLLEDDLQNVAIADSNPTIVPALENSASDMNGSASATASNVEVESADRFSQSSENAIEEPSVLAGLSAGGGLVAPGVISFTGNSTSFRLSLQLLPPQDVFGNGGLLMNPDGSTAEPGRIALDNSTATMSGNLPGGSADAGGMASADASMSTDGMAPQVADHQTIIWQFQAPGVLSGTQALRPGLYRIQTESLALQTALSQQDSMPEASATDSEGSVDQMTLEALLFPPMESSNLTDATNGVQATNGEQPSPLIPTFDAIPEVVSCRFEYFSGSEWASTWNSDQQQGLPVAVRVTLRLVTPDNLIRLTQIYGEGSGDSSLLDEAMNSSAPAAASTQSKPSMPLQPGDDPGAEPLTAIPTQQIERIILLQPIAGPMPQPGTGTDSLNGDPDTGDAGSEGGV